MGGFTLVELLVSVAIMSTLLGLAALAVSSLKSGGDVNTGAYDLAAALEAARTYAVTNDTYAWVGFFEEDAGTPGVAGIGSVIVSVVAAKDGVQGFNPNQSASATNRLDSTRLTQIGNLIKIGNTHLVSLADGSGTGSTLAARPRVGELPFPDAFARIDDVDNLNVPPASLFPFQYPVSGATASPPTAQYTFRKTIQFNPRGESRVNSTYDMRPIVEIGLQPAHGSVPDLHSSNLVAIQLTGISGTVKIYRK